VFSYCPVLSVIFCAAGEEESGQLAAAGSVRLADRIGIGVLTRLVPWDLIAETPAEPGRRDQRFRLLPAHIVIFRDGWGGLP
jgi:Insertion element 4 transposase N-terminal